MGVVSSAEDLVVFACQEPIEEHVVVVVVVDTVALFGVW